jgi:hypothetical protein
MTDTRAGFWLQLAVVLLTVAVVAADCLFGHAQDQTLREMLSIAVAPASVLLPIVGILLVTSEWSQRTGMVTFALVPRRGRVVAANLLAGVVLSLVALALCIVAAVIGTAIASAAIENAWAFAGRPARPARRVARDGHDLRRGARRGAARLGAGHRVPVRAAAGLWRIQRGEIRRRPA